MMTLLLKRKRADEKSATIQSRRSYRPFIVSLTARILWFGWGMMVRKSGNAGGVVKFLPPNMHRALSAMSLRFERMILQFASRRFRRSITKDIQICTIP